MELQNEIKPHTQARMWYQQNNQHCIQPNQQDFLFELKKTLNIGKMVNKVKKKPLFIFMFHVFTALAFLY